MYRLGELRNSPSVGSSRPPYLIAKSALLLLASLARQEQSACCHEEEEEDEEGRSVISRPILFQRRRWRQSLFDDDDDDDATDRDRPKAIRTNEGGEPLHRTASSSDPRKVCVWQYCDTAPVRPSLRGGVGGIQDGMGLILSAMAGNEMAREKMGS